MGVGVWVWVCGACRCMALGERLERGWPTTARGIVAVLTVGLRRDKREPAGLKGQGGGYT